MNIQCWVQKKRSWTELKRVVPFTAISLVPYIPSLLPTPHPHHTSILLLRNLPAWLSGDGLSQLCWSSMDTVAVGNRTLPELLQASTPCHAPPQTQVPISMRIHTSQWPRYLNHPSVSGDSSHSAGRYLMRGKRETAWQNKPSSYSQNDIIYCWKFLQIDSSLFLQTWKSFRETNFSYCIRFYDTERYSSFLIENLQGAASAETFYV